MRTADSTESAREALAMVVLPCADLDATLAFFYTFVHCSGDLQLLEVAMPGQFATLSVSSAAT